MIVRRLSFMFIVLREYDNSLKQLWAIQIINLISFVYLIEVKPYKEPFLNKMELFNEVSHIVCVDLMFCFTNLISFREEQMFFMAADKVGTLFVIVLTSVIAVHITFLVVA